MGRLANPDQGQRQIDAVVALTGRIAALPGNPFADLPLGELGEVLLTLNLIRRRNALSC